MLVVTCRDRSNLMLALSENNIPRLPDKSVDRLRVLHVITGQVYVTVPTK